MKSKRIGVVMGGTSAEREISLRSGRAVARALEKAGHDVVRLELAAQAHALRMLSEARLDVAFLGSAWATRRGRLHSRHARAFRDPLYGFERAWQRACHG